MVSHHCASVRRDIAKIKMPSPKRDVTEVQMKDPENPLLGYGKEIGKKERKKEREDEQEEKGGRNRDLRSWPEAMYDLCQNTTMHGLKQTTEPQPFFIRRVNASNDKAYCRSSMIDASELMSTEFQLAAPTGGLAVACSLDNMNPQIKIDHDKV
ncbi:hypothetical protein CAPTEDRAFT_212994 [Capitella teleta]|uniref:Uncharacterized protein n=1 Tax=Capitella teleta TaxID=283909 RepID=R7TMT2_CAPTE|nr:hypothetical protein CAPTEDRAFT_212994 [Capitella teleta]|eukprot:ELT94812.1 hypothetical protein CAPTEDRAFT_212994 [Capitella teleta]